MTAQYAEMQPADLDAVVEAEQLCHEYPWTRGNFVDSLAAGYAAWLVREAGRMTGYAVMMRAPDEVHLLNITILPDLQRRGHGSALLRHLFGQASTLGATRMLLEVRPSNASGLALYRRHDFSEIGRRRDYYPARIGREDAIVMARAL